MDSAFFSDLLASIAERGRSVLKLSPWPRDAVNRAASLADMCRALLSGRGEASGVALASEILGRYRSLGEDDRGAFFRALAEDFGPDRTRIESAIARFTVTGGEAAAAEVHYASEPRRQELFRRLNRAPGGTAALVAMRADLIAAMRDDRGLFVLDRDFLHLLGSWFNRGFLVLRRIDWSSPAAVLEKIIRYEAVHEIHGWDDLRRRIDSVDRRCYAFFHPALVDEPLIFVEVALTLTAPAAIAPLLAERRGHVAEDKARAATFYSISNCQAGPFRRELRQFPDQAGGRGNSPRTAEDRDIRDAVARPGLQGLGGELRRPGGRDAGQRPCATSRSRSQWAENPEAAARMRKALEPLAAHYFLKVRRSDGRVVDPVARFHLGNGARLERINPMGDLSEKGLAESYGVMVNYQYDLTEIERNHEAFANQNVVAASSAVKKLSPAARLRAPAAALPAPGA